MDELERRAERTLGTTGVPPAAEAASLASLEGEILAAAAGLDGRGHPAIADLARFRDRAAAAGAPAAAERAEALACAIVADGASEIGQPEGAEACFRELEKARELDLLALARTSGPPPLADARAALRDRLRAAPPPPPGIHDAWAKELLDRADITLSALDVVEPARAARMGALAAEEIAWHAREIPCGLYRRALARRARRLADEAQERELEARLEARFGRRNVRLFERTVLAATLLVLALLAIETFVELPRRTLVWFAVADTAACAFFLWDVAVRLLHVRGRARWFLRHFLLDVLPSIPFALLLLHPTHLDSVYALRALRLARLRPLVRLVRAFGFLSRGIDRLVRGYGHALNRDIVLYPTREERAELATGDRPAVRLLRLEARVQERWIELLRTAGGVAEEVASARLAALEEAHRKGHLRRRQMAQGDGAPRALMADDLLRRLERLTPEEAATLGEGLVARLARIARLVSLPPLRWFPILRRYVPRLAEETPDAAAVAAAARSSASQLRRMHGRWLWFADLHGTISPAQFVDRVGTALMKVSIRPAYRLVLFALIVFVLRVIFEVSGLSWLDHLAHTIFRFAGILGSICMVSLAIGWWLKRAANEATAFFEQAAQAQYIALTEVFKGRTLERDARVLDRRVLAPERLLRGEAEGASGAELVAQMREWLVAAQPSGMLTPAVERVILLYRDGLDGAPFNDSDTRTTSQLLGNPALRNLRSMSRRFSPREMKLLMKLDLDRPTSLLKGPYFWFRLMCRAVAHGVARLVVDYNRHALALPQLGAASEEERATYARWLKATEVAEIRPDQVRYTTTHFTALHFLDDDARGDAEVEQRFGADVLARLRRDRRLLFRRVFGTYPVAKLPRDRRVLNPFRVYQRWFAGGRALVLPLFMAWAALRRIGDFLGWLRRCVRELKGPSVNVDTEAADGADFAAALRKIARARGPVAEAALRLRIRLDVEYLGVRLPGTEESGLEGKDVSADLRFLDAGADLEREVGGERGRAERDMRRLAALAPEAPSRDHLRAAACAYHADLDGVRSLLSAREILDEVAARAVREPLLPAARPRPKLHALFRRWWKAHGGGGLRARRAVWRAIAHDTDGAAAALVAWAQPGARERGERLLRDLMRHPERIAEMLVTLRAVQTLSLLDILLYREQVYRLGRYAESGDEAGRALDVP